MKKITYLTFLFGLLATVPSYGQHELSSAGPEQPDTEYKSFNLRGDIHQKAPELASSWFNFFAELRDTWGVNTVFFRTSLFPDSTVLVQNGTNFDFAFKHSFGQVLDPTSSYHFSPINSAAAYSVDTIGIPYRYFRPQKANPDTLIISMFKENQLNINPSPGWSTPRSYANAPYDYMARKGDNPYREIVFILDDEHEMDETEGLLMVAVDEDINPGEIVAFTFTYFPGNTWNPGDTLANTINEPNAATRNCFNIFDGRDDDATLDNDFYNMGQWVTKDIRYNILANTNGWEESYVPGVAYGNSSGVRHMDVNFKLTYEDFTGINELGRDYGFHAYPNPFGDQLTFNYEVKPSEQARIEVYNVLGKKLKNATLNAAEKQLSMNMEELPAGIYFANLVINNTVITSSRIVKE